MDSKPKNNQPLGVQHKFKRLYDLGADRMAVIDMMLTNGDSTQKVVEKIQIDWNECAGVKSPTLDKQLQRYRKNIVEPRLIIATENAHAAGVATSEGMKKFRDQVDVMDKLNQSINMQWSRIEKAYAKEQLKGNTGKLDPNLSKELRPFTDMCRVLSALQLETGVVRRIPKQVQGFFQQLDSNELQEFRIEMTTNDDTLKALATLKQVIQEAAGEIIDGDYLPVTPQFKTISGPDAEAVESESSGDDSSDAPDDTT